MLERIPDGAEVVLLPKDDPELYRINLEAGANRGQVRPGRLCRDQGVGAGAFATGATSVCGPVPPGNGTLMRRRRSRPN